MKKAVGLGLGIMMMAGSTLGVSAETAYTVATWSVGSYPGTSSSGQKLMLDDVGYATTNISCSSYSSTSGSVIAFSSSNFYAAVGIAGTGSVRGSKRTAKPGNTYYVKYYADSSGRTIANGQINS